MNDTPLTNPAMRSKPKLTMDAATQLGGALARIHELSSKSIIESTDAAERRGLENYVAGVLRENAEQLLSCWFAVTTEYEPMIAVFAALTRRAAGLNKQIFASMQPKSDPPPETEPAKPTEGQPSAEAEAKIIALPKQP